MARRETYLTPEGLAKLEAELANLRSVRRQEVAQRIQRAKELGGTVDNADYEEAKNEQAFVEGRVLALENMIKNAVLIPGERAPSEGVQLGSVVTVVDPQGKTHRYAIVGKTEANPSEGKISNESPVGKALLGHKEGEQAEVVSPAGVARFHILTIA